MKTTWNRLALFSLIVFTSSALRASTYFLQSLGGTEGPPMPYNPDPSDPMTEIRPDVYVVEDGTASSTSSPMMVSSSTMSADSLDPSGGGTEGDNGLSQPAPVRNYTKYGTQDFLMLDTNSILLGDNNTNLYEACANMPEDTNTAAILVIARYGPNSVIIRADNFDQGYIYTNADFALLICDNVADPIWKPIDFGGASDAQDGWLVQGRVPSAQVSSTMFMMVTNLNTSYNAFFCAIPYTGPQVAITGTNQPYDTVSNTITLTTQILDLSGTTNETFDVSVDDAPARYSLSTSNITLDTHYNTAGTHSVNLTVQGLASVNNTTNPPPDTELFYAQSATMPLDFENDTYLVFASDYASPDLGTNYFYYNIDKAQNVACIITDPANGNNVLAFTNYVSTPGTVYFGWNFTEGDGVTPYSNDTYVVQFIAFDPASLANTNTIFKTGVRQAAGCYLTHVTENPGTSQGSYMDNAWNYWTDTTMVSLYQNVYYQYGLTQYGTWQVGNNRNLVGCQPLDSGHTNWTAFMQPALTNTVMSENTNVPAYSDLSVCGAHGNGAAIGGDGVYLTDTFTPAELARWLQGVGNNWRLRKAALWSCFSGNMLLSPKNYWAFQFPDGCGILQARIQENSYCQKNVGLFFWDLVPEYGYAGTASITVPEVALDFDQTWMCGPNQYPGGCDPTYTFRWAVQETINQYPELDQQNGHAGATVKGFKKLPYTGIYDAQLQVLNTSSVKDPAN